jgi:hypothetical protein
MTTRTSSVVVACVLLAASTSVPAGESGWIQLFNGKNLDGWTPKITGYEAGDNHGNTFRVEDGLLKVVYGAYDTFGGRFGHLFYKDSFASYRLRVEYRFVGEQAPGGPGWAVRNSGLMLHGQTPGSMRKDQEFPVSIEVQLLGGTGKGERTTANLCTPGTHVVMDGELLTRHCTNSRSQTYHGEQWVTAEVEVRGRSITHFVAGEPVLAYTDPQLDDGDRDGRALLEAGHEKMLRGGTISLQSESHPVEFRTVELLVLDDAPEEKGDAGGWVDLLAGGDLAKNWRTKGNWKLDKEGVVTLTPRPGEEGWSRFDAYLWLNGVWKDFEIEFEYKVEKGGNSGFYFHVGDEASPVARGIEVQIYESHAKGKDAKLTDHDSGGIIPGIPPSRNAARPAGEWNRFHITCKGTNLTVRLNGEVVNEIPLDHPGIKDRPREGSIGFQDHALPLSLRKIRIRR